eukprot:376518_1
MDEPLIFLPDSLKELLCKIFPVISMVLLISVGLYHVISLKKHKGLNTYTKSLYLSLLLLLCGIFTLTGLTLQTFTPYKHNIFCKLSQFGGISSYISFKAVLYLLFVVRLKECYQNSVIRQNSTVLLCWTIVLLVWSIFNIVLIIFTTSIYLDLDAIPFCIVALKQYSLISMGLLDVIACVVNLYLFIHPLYILTHVTEETAKDKNHSFINNDTKALKHIAIKQCILSVIATVTTVAVIICVMLFDMSPMFASIDVVLSLVCIILMYRWNAFITDRICCCYAQHIKNEKQLSVVIHKESNKTERSNTMNTVTIS